MARTARVVAAGVPMHVIQRGNNRARVFRNTDDRAAYRDAMFRCAQATDCAIHSYVLMSNHVHILLTPRHVNSTARMMRRLGAIYVPQFNDRYQRTGTLWENRFRSLVIESDRYFFACSRYIELNPVRAGMVNNPAEHAWSSYAANTGGTPDKRLHQHELYVKLGASAAGRCREYRAMFANALPPETLETLRGKGVAGSDEFCARVTGRAKPAARGGDRRSAVYRQGAGTLSVAATSVRTRRSPA